MFERVGFTCLRLGIAAAAACVVAGCGSDKPRAAEPVVPASETAVAREPAARKSGRNESAADGPSRMPSAPAAPALATASPNPETSAPLKSTGLLSGRVVDLQGQAVEGAQVEIASGAAADPGIGAAARITALTDSMGQFSTAEAPVGVRLRVSAAKGSSRSGKPLEIRLAAGESRTDLQLAIQTAGFIAGRITDAAGEPVVGASVTVVQADGRTVTAAAGTDGRYRVDAVENGPVSASAWAEKYTTGTKQNVDLGRANVTFILAPLRVMEFTGRAVDEETKQPVGGIRVRALGPGDVEVEDAGPGTFSVRNLTAASPLRLRLEADGYAAYDTGPIVLTEQQQGAIRQFELGKGGSIIGRVVTRDDDERPLTGIAVEARAGLNDKPVDGEPLARTVTGADGKFVLSGVASGAWQVVAVQASPRITSSKGVEVKRSGETDAGDIRLGEIRLGTLRGKVVRLPKNEPVEGIDVTLGHEAGEPSQSVSTDASGTFTFENVTPAHYVVRAPEFRVAMWASVLEGEAPKDLVLSVGAGRLAAKLLRAGKPLDGWISVRQSAQNFARSERTKADGSAVFETLSPGPWMADVVPQDKSIAARKEVIEILPEGTTEVTFDMSAGRAVGRVTDAAGNPKPGAQVTVSFRPPDVPLQTLRAISDAEGRFAIEGMPEGVYAVDAKAPGQEGGVARVEGVVVPATGDSSPVELKLAGKGGTLESTCLSMGDSAPLQKAWCFMDTEAGPFNHGSGRGADGVVRISDIPPGTYKVRVGAYGFSNVEHSVEIKEGETAKLQDVLYEAGAANVFLADATGAPLAGVDVKMEPQDAASIETVRTSKTDAMGKWVERGLFPGRYIVTATPAGRSPVTGALVVRASNVTSVRLAAE